jgi:hypothetical protein
MSYGEVLSNAWKTIWKYKVLWIFGILAGLGSSGGGSGRGSSGPNFNNNGNQPDFLNPTWANPIGRWLEQNWWIFIVAAVLIFLLVIVIIILSTYGRIGLTRGAWKADEGAARLTFGELFAESGRYFWRVLGLALLMFIIAVGASLVIGVGTAGVALFTLGLGLLCLIPFFCVLGVVAWVVEIIVRLAVIAIAGEDLGVIDGLRRAWNTVRAHLGESIVMGLILGIGSGILRIIISLPFLAVLIPLVPLVASQTQQTFERGAIGAAVIFCAYLPFAIFLGGIVESYVGTAWTLTYRRLTGRSRTAVEVA